MMQLELIGCTGAGKSTLADGLFHAARRGRFELASGDQVVLNRLGCNAVASPALRTWLIHAATLGMCVTHRRYAGFASLARQSLHSAGISRRHRWNQLRKVLKQLGRYEWIRLTSTRCGWALVDEGTLQSAHNLFVHVGYRLNEQQLRRFAECVPLPDMAIYLRPSEEVLIERTLRRGHPRIDHPTPRTVAEFVRQALDVFDQVTRHERIADRTILIDKGAIVRAPESSTAGAQSVVELVKRTLGAHGMTPRHSLPEEPAHRANVMT